MSSTGGVGGSGVNGTSANVRGLLSSLSTPALHPCHLRVEMIETIAQGIANVTAAAPRTIPSHAMIHAAERELAEARAKGDRAGAAAAAASASASMLSPLLPLPAPAAAHLAAHAEHRLRSLLSVALSFARHSSGGARRVLSTDDFNRALKSRKCRPLLGYENAAWGRMGAAGSTSTSSNGMNGTDGSTLTTSDTPAALHFSQASEDLFVVNDALVNFEDLIQQPLPRVPADSTFSLHWLAIDGVQPSIPQNPTPEQIASATVGGAAATAAQTAVATTAPSTTVMLNQSEKEVVTKGPVKHVLSREQQLYYEYVTSAIRGSDRTLKAAIFKSLHEDDGLYQLLPYFTQFIAEEVSNNLQNLGLLRSLMKAALCITRSPYLHVEPYLHQLVPSILTCIVSRQLCSEPFEDHWELRNEAASHLVEILVKYGLAYPTLQPRITNTLLKAWMDPHRPMNTHYGCVVAIHKMGALAVKRIIVPYVAAYIAALTPALHSANEVTRIEASHVYHALQSAIGDYVRWEMIQAADPNTMAAAVKEAMEAGKDRTAGRGEEEEWKERATSMELDTTGVKKEPVESAATALSKPSKKRHRDTATASSSPSTPFSAAAAASAVLALPDESTLEGIELLLELFGEGLQHHVEAALQSITPPSNTAAAHAIMRNNNVATMHM